MSRRYPQPGEIYESRIYPGQHCKVIGVLEAMVTLQWIGRYAHVEEQCVPVNQFVQDFELPPRALE